jgi:hypothetical protein
MSSRETSSLLYPPFLLDKVLAPSDRFTLVVERLLDGKM